MFLAKKNYLISPYTCNLYDLQIYLFFKLDKWGLMFDLKCKLRSVMYYKKTA